MFAKHPCVHTYIKYVNRKRIRVSEPDVVVFSQNGQVCCVRSNAFCRPHRFQAYFREGAGAEAFLFEHIHRVNVLFRFCSHRVSHPIRTASILRCLLDTWQHPSGTPI